MQMNSWSQLQDTYEILEKLGEGSGGIVYKAYHRRLQKEVVLKRIKSGYLSAMNRRQETDILKNLKHSYLPQVLDFLELEDGVYTVMSYIPGQTFEKLLKQNYRFSKMQLQRWGMQLSSALNYLHSQQPPIIHGDIKPANIILTPQGDICLIDFNIAFFLNEHDVMGYSAGYSSPEQYEAVTRSRERIPEIKSGYIDERSDIYSVGATLYHICTGDKYGKKLDKQALITNGGYAFAQIIEKTLEKSPQKRFQSAYELFLAFQKMPEQDQSYLKLSRKQKLVKSLLVVFLLVFIVISGMGVREYRTEQTARYNQLVEMQMKYQESGELQKETDAYEKAIKIKQTALESYYQHANMLYLTGDYQACIDFIQYSILENDKIDKLQTEMAEVYHIQADSYFQLQSYDQALLCYEKMESLGSENPEYYRDYAITLAYAGESQRAEEVLETAVSQGLADDSVYYAKAEIEKSTEQYDLAIQDFSTCMKNTTDDKLKARAYLNSAAIYEVQNDLSATREVLLLAEENLPKENQLLILNKLVQVDIELSDRMDENLYRQEATQALQQIITMGWNTFETYNNLVVLYEKQGDLVSAEKTLQTMESLYQGDYRVYKRYAFLELDKQNQLENQQRDYALFINYYETAKKNYEKQQGNNKDTDEEMLLLDQSYGQLEEGGWI
jgi:serine/threonine protein kinase